jgi:hypothetical protein
MVPITRSVFRLISTRAAKSRLIISPDDYIANSSVLQTWVDWSSRQRPGTPLLPPRNLAFKGELDGSSVLTLADVLRSPLQKVAEVFEGSSPKSLSKLASAPLTIGNQSLTFSRAITDSTEAQRSVLQLLDSWYTHWWIGKSNQETLEAHRRLLRAACVSIILSKGRLKNENAIVLERLRNAKVVLPRLWAPAWRTFAISQNRIPEVPKKTGTKSLEISRKIKAQEFRTKYQSAVKEAQAYEQILVALTRLEANERSVQPTASQEQGKLHGENIIAKITAQLPQELQATFARRIQGTLPTSYAQLTAAFNSTIVIQQGYDFFAEVEAIEEDEYPPFTTNPPGSTAPIVSAVGIGDLIVAREKLLRYEAHEIAHIENVLRGETRLRHHETLHRTELTSEVEEIREKTTEKDLQTTDRFELQSMSQETISREFSLDAGVNTSGTYGLTSVETSLNAGFATSESKSRSDTINLAKEVIAKTSERTFERARQLRRLITIDEIKEINKHEFSNGLQPSGTTPQTNSPVDISGIYKWVEKVHEVELRHYGARLMLEFIIPEPAMTLHEHHRKNVKKKSLPKFNVRPTDINEISYLFLARKYRADVSPPPPIIKTNSYNWTSASSESADQWGEVSFSGMVECPSGYEPNFGTLSLSLLTYIKLQSIVGQPHIMSAEPKHALVNFRVMAGGRVLADRGLASDLPGATAGEYSATWTFGLTDYPGPWVSGVPVNGWVHGAGDNTVACQAVIRFVRSNDEYRRWQLDTWAALREGYDQLNMELQRESQRKEIFPTLGRSMTDKPAAEYRKIEREELQKWSIKALSGNGIDLNLVELFSSREEPHLDLSHRYAPQVSFFQNAFEWKHMSYLLFPYFWARRESWQLRLDSESNDPQHRSFLSAGSAKVVVPVKGGYEELVLRYLEQDPESHPSALERIQAAQQAAQTADNDAETENSVPRVFDDLWIELMETTQDDLARGIGYLSVEHGSPQVHILQMDNEEVSPTHDLNWKPNLEDLGRELFIRGTTYTVTAFSEDRQSVTVNPVYHGDSSPREPYAIGSKPFGAPWTVNLPTSLVILESNASRLDVNAST